MIVATSLSEWIHKWSRYCFSDPAPKGKPYDLTILADSRPGVFDWAPSTFLPTLDREAKGAFVSYPAAVPQRMLDLEARVRSEMKSRISPPPLPPPLPNSEQ